MYLNIFNVDTSVRIKDIFDKFASFNLEEVIPIGKSKKIYDLKFLNKKDLLMAAEI